MQDAAKVARLSKADYSMTSSDRVPCAYTAAATRTLVHVNMAARTGKPYTERHLQGCDLRSRRFCSTGKVLELAQV